MYTYAFYRRVLVKRSNGHHKHTFEYCGTPSVAFKTGEKSPAVLERGCPMDFDKVKRIMNEALSSESVVAMQPLIQHVVDKYTASWHQSAKEQKVRKII